MIGITQINSKSEDIVWQKTDIGKAERCIVKNHKPCVIWFTGLNCSRDDIFNFIKGH